MIGQLVSTPGGRGRTIPGRLYGLPVLRAEADRSGFWGDRRLRRAAQGLRRGGALRVLASHDLLPMLKDLGLRQVDPELFVRAQSVPLALTALERQGLCPGRTALALRGLRADRDMARTAAQLCPQVRGLIIDAPRGGNELAQWLRQEYGVPVLPPWERGQAALTFQQGCSPPEETVLELWGPRPQLAGLSLTAPGLAEDDRADLPLLAALWEGGKLGPKDIKIT